MTIWLLVCLLMCVLSGLWKLAGICPEAWWERGWWPCVPILVLSVDLNSGFKRGCYCSAAHRRQGLSLSLPVFQFPLRSQQPSPPARLLQNSSAEGVLMSITHRGQCLGPSVWSCLLREDDYLCMKWASCWFFVGTSWVLLFQALVVEIRKVLIGPCLDRILPFK